MMVRSSEGMLRRACKTVVGICSALAMLCRSDKTKEIGQEGYLVPCRLENCHGASHDIF